MSDNNISDEMPPLKALIDKYNLRAKKSLGQNFLIDKNIIRKIIEFAKIDKDDDKIAIVEIGAGAGSLTRELITETRKPIFAIELDKRCLPLLEELSTHYSNGQLQIIEADALKIDITDIVTTPIMIIANLPYNVATALLFKWLDDIYRSPSSIKNMTLMFQKEVAERIIAKPNSKPYGRLSVIAQWLCNIEYGFDIAPQSFIPAPKVTSTVLRFTPRTTPLFNADKRVLEKVVAAAFNQRRKMLRSSLKKLHGNIEILLEKEKIHPTSRAENLTIEEFCKLARAI